MDLKSKFKEMAGFIHDAGFKVLDALLLPPKISPELKEASDRLDAEARNRPAPLVTDALGGVGMKTARVIDTITKRP